MKPRARFLLLAGIALLALIVAAVAHRVGREASQARKEMELQIAELRRDQNAPNSVAREAAAAAVNDAES
ncbi:MAG TPA: hypothetical protein VHF69_05680, partial [Candidatus Synoicihabitans sp.]|nr:hypothetical protein [Candidatus Synoicihabitans sp.]